MSASRVSHDGKARKALVGKLTERTAPGTPFNGAPLSRHEETNPFRPIEELFMKLTFAATAAVILCLLSLAARSSAIRAALLASTQTTYADQERLALAAIDGHLRHRLAKK
jgi:hypothetical protein